MDPKNVPETGTLPKSNDELSQSPGAPGDTPRVRAFSNKKQVFKQLLKHLFENLMKKTELGPNSVRKHVKMWLGILMSILFTEFLLILVSFLLAEVLPVHLFVSYPFCVIIWSPRPVESDVQFDVHRLLCS